MYNILIVDDNPSFVKALELLIRTVLGLKLEVFNFASNGLEAIEKVRSNTHYDYIFMDANMPLLDGISTTKLINQEFYRDTKIIAVSFDSEFQTIKDMFFSGASYFICKEELTFEVLSKIFEEDLAFKGRRAYS